MQRRSHEEAGPGRRGCPAPAHLDRLRVRLQGRQAGPERCGEEIAKNIADSFSSGTSGTLTKAESTCFANDFVSSAGVKGLEDAKLIDDKGELNQADAKFTEALAGQFADAFLGCVDYQKRQAEEIAKADTKVDAVKLADCLSNKMPEAEVKKLIVASYTQAKESTTLLQDAQKALETCKKSATKK
jgi:hypothetical protein